MRWLASFMVVSGVLAGGSVPSHGAPLVAQDPASGMFRSSIISVAYDGRVQRAQGLLNKLGYDAGPEDGLMGAKTRSALRQFQTDHRLSRTGDVNRETMGALRTEAESGGSSGNVGTPSSTTTSAEDATSKRLLIDIQTELRRRGYDVPVVNGSLDERTKQAIADYQRAEGLLVTAEPSELLLARIRSTDAASDGLSRREMIKQIQANLNDRGYSAGPPDGLLGRSTQDAIRTYQADAGLKVDGAASAELLAKLKGSDTAETTPATQSPAAQSDEPRVLISDTFDDGDYTQNVRWQVLQGTFSVRDGKLFSDIAGSSDTAAKSPEDFARQILKGVLEQAADLPAASKVPPAAIVTYAKIPNTFNVRSRFTVSGDTSVRLNLGVFQNTANSGYRVALGNGLVELIAVEDGRDSRLVARANTGWDIATGSVQHVEWSRTSDNVMHVSLNGRTFIEVQDTGFSDPFDGILIMNSSGAWSIDDIEVISSGGK